MREIIMSAATIPEARKLGSQSLGVAEEDCLFEIIEMPKKKLFGSTKAKVRVYIEDADEDVMEAVKEAMKSTETAQETPPENKPSSKQVKPVFSDEKEDRIPVNAEDLSEKNQGKLELAKSYLTDILDNLGCEAHIEEKVYEDGAVLTIEGQSLGTIIGRRGETLDAIQYLTGLVSNRGDDSYYRITVDCQGYRDKRVATLQQLAVRMAEKAIKTGRSTRLEPMNPFERRIIHASVSTVEGAVSSSYGEEPNRRVVIAPKNKPFREDRDRRGGKSTYGDRRSDRGPRRDSSPRPPRPPRSPEQAPSTTPQAPKSDFDELDDIGTGIGLYGKIEL